jgi:hypothetical protein
MLFDDDGYSTRRGGYMPFSGRTARPAEKKRSVRYVFLNFHSSSSSSSSSSFTFGFLSL